MKHQQGIGLPELIIGFFLSTLLMMLLLQHVIQVKRQSQTITESIDRALELQWVSRFIQHRVHAAGHTPCLRLDHLERFDARAKPEPLDILTIDDEPDARLTIRRMHEHSEEVVLQLSPNELIVSKPVGRAGQAVLIADCYHAEVHDIREIIQQEPRVTLILNEPLMFHYTHPFYVGEWMAESFFIRSMPGHVSGLFYQHHRVDELTSRVHDLSVIQDTVNGYIMLHVVLLVDNTRKWPMNIAVRAL